MNESDLQYVYCFGADGFTPQPTLSRKRAAEYLRRGHKLTDLFLVPNTFGPAPFVEGNKARRRAGLPVEGE